MSQRPIVLTETCVCGAKTEVVARPDWTSDIRLAHDALAAWRRDHRHEKPRATAVRIPLAKRRA